MFNDWVQFEPPAEITVEIVQNGKVLLVQLNFPGIRKLSTSYLGPFRQRSGYFSCFTSNKNFFTLKEHSWCKVIDNKAPSSVQHSGEWISVQMDKKPANYDLWLRIFRRRISVMLTPQKNERWKASSTEVHGVNRYYVWDSGRLNRILNPQKSEILVTDDNLSLRLACDGELWTDEDATALRSGLQRRQSEDALGEIQIQFSGGDVVLDEKPNSIEKKVATPERIEAKERHREKERPLGANMNSNEYAPNKAVSEEPVKFDSGPEEKIHEIKGLEKQLDLEPPEQIDVVERATSSTDICELVDASTATCGQMANEEKVHPCHYCLGVQEQVGKAEFSALQARVEAMNKEQWARVLDIIVGKSNTSKVLPLKLENASNKASGDGAKKVVDTSNDTQQTGKKRPPVRNARYVIQNRNRADGDRRFVRGGTGKKVVISS
ncbi:hypothetical protein Aperf_G00000059561 [Anoplocephala perfoliata]